MKTEKLILHNWYYDTYFKCKVRYYGEDKNTVAPELNRYVFMRESYSEDIMRKEQVEKRIKKL